MSKKMLAISLAALLAAGSASAQMPGDGYKGVKPCPDSASFEYVGASLFATDKSTPTPIEMGALGRGYERATKEFRGSNYIWVHIKGMTDSVGSDAYNDALGQRRAEAVKKSLVEQGVQTGMVHVKSFGERYPKYDNKTASGRQMNRAAHVSIVAMDQEVSDGCYANHPESVPKGPWWNLP